MQQSMENRLVVQDRRYLDSFSTPIFLIIIMAILVRRSVGIKN